MPNVRDDPHEKHEMDERWEAMGRRHRVFGIGGVFLALGIPALFGPLAGHLADRAARHPLLLITNAAFRAASWAFDGKRRRCSRDALDWL